MNPNLDQPQAPWLKLTSNMRKKPDGQKKPESRIVLTTTRERKNAYVKAAYARNMTLADWMFEVCDAAAGITKPEVITLEYWNGETWARCGEFFTESMAWISLGGDDANYRTIDAAGNVLTDKSKRGES